MSFEAPLYAVAVASAIIFIILTSIPVTFAVELTGENAIKKSSFRRALDCCATSKACISA